MNITITSSSQAEYDAITELWEQSVRATHHFLTEADIDRLRPLIRHNYLKAVTLLCAQDSAGTIVGFMGVSGRKLEMLFIAPSHFGKGIGSQLLLHAISRMDVTQVDVNEQNPAAAGFYKHHGFEIDSRSALDGEGNPFPILHLRLDKKSE
ncbi:GNAT family N-acetyltransferase [Oleidesulfovibrio sp.]|uniref:GNAT family N-acetyltransferase n=1 Tax=Oleidesulfovibrio sp. TaxID=2909707 RepID=UPI003A896B89